jgi:hypothetical protein
MNISFIVDEDIENIVVSMIIMKYVGAFSLDVYIVNENNFFC